MQKINFQDTEVVKAPYVEINGVEYEVESEYQGGTDLDAEVFNQMQDNIEAAINNIPVYDDSQMKTGWYEITPTVSLTYASFDNNTKIGVLNTSRDLQDNFEIGTKLKFYNDDSWKYGIVIAITSSTITIYLGKQSLENDDIEQVKYSIVESPVGYPNYMNRLDQLTLPVEIPVGVWGNDIKYRKQITVSSGITALTQIAHGISNVGKICVTSGYILIGADDYRPLPAQIYSPEQANNGGIYNIYDGNVQVTLNSYWAERATKIEVVIEYTKTTD